MFRFGAFGSLAVVALMLMGQPCNAQEKIRAGYIPVSDYLPAFVAQEKGFFKNHGLDVELVRVPLISNIPPALLAGDLQFGINTATGFLSAVDAGLDLVLVAGSARISERGNNVSLVVGKESGITTPKELKGKRVAVSGLSSALDLLLRKWLLLKGIDPKDVNIVEVGFPLQSDALKAKQIDAVVTIEPFRSRMIDNGVATKLSDFMLEVSNNQLGNFWQSTRQWTTTHARQTADFRQSLQEGIDFIKTNEDEAHQIEKKFLGMSSTVLPVFSVPVTRDDLQFYLDLCRQFGTVSNPIDLDKLIVR